MAASRRSWWLGALLAVGLGMALWIWSGGATPTASVNRPARTADGGAARSGEQDEIAPVDVRLEALKSGRAVPTEATRNPFRFQARAPSTQAGGPGGTAGSVVPPTPAVPTGPPPPPPIALKFIGVVEKADGTKVAVLSGSGYPLYGREGDIIDGRYRVLKIGVESIEVAYVDGRGRQTIRLTGQ
jgi:hypothetical protein